MLKNILYGSLLIVCCSSLQGEESQFTHNDCLAKKTTNTSLETPAPITNLEGEPSAYVHDCVNVITGHYCEFHRDLVVPHGTDPLQLERSFAGSCESGGILGHGWHLNHSSALVFNIFSYKPDLGGSI